jgi:hypothetical protein
VALLTKTEFQEHYQKVFMKAMKRIDICYNSAKHLKEYAG